MRPTQLEVSMALGYWALLVLGISAAAGQARTQGQGGGETGPDYATVETRTVIEAMVMAHGGMDAWRTVETVRFRMLSKVSGQSNPWLSTETVERSSGRSFLDWPILDASIVWDGTAIWSVNWPPAPPPGFFPRLSYAFVTLPFLTQDDGVSLGPVERGQVPADSTEYLTVHMTYPQQNASVPGDYYKLFIDPASHRLKAVEFNITHPGMIANPNQALGPIVHVFEEYTAIGPLTLPTYYVTFGFNPRNKNVSNALHIAFDISLDGPFDESRMQRPANAVTDVQTLTFWESR
jgi:hypothetical protein